MIHIALLSRTSLAADPTISYDFKLSYITVSPLGVPQKVLAINGQFPGPLVNATTNNNVIIKVYNDLDEDLLMTWPGIQMRRNSWQDGVLGTNCPIPPKWDFNYTFQPDGDFTLLIGDWYTRNHTALRADLDSGKDLGMPDGVLINGKGPYRYNTTLVPDGLPFETIKVDPGKTYRFRVHNVGTSTSLNFRIQGHNLLLVETEGYYTVQQNYTSFDIHVGQSSSFLVTMDQNATSDYYIVASARFVNESIWQKVTGVGILHYSNSKGPVAGPLPEAPSDIYNQWSAMNQPKAIRQNTSASGARPNPQGSYHYGSINVTDTYILRSLPPSTIDGKLRATLNGISFVNPATPIRLADLNKVKGSYKLDFPSAPLNRTFHRDTSIINATYKGFIEIILQNNDTRMQSFHMNGYSFFIVGMDWGIWSENSRGSYNKWDAISRSTVEVYPGGWTAVLASLDNAGVWNLRVENLDRWYLGQETYMRIINPEENGETEMAPPDNVLYCGALASKQQDRSHKSGVSIIHGNPNLFFTLLMALCAVFIFS
ncbi:MONOCOPPER OXIDASE-LIKE PROTEIN SKS1 [Salix purpurea]|uniref:MONOCOPPER OXIDASE-LIKE PROTEIN SKS1 n=1 Tax=Salix purpurea TaxID=77065 RepID=A0A9Q0ZV62_SALPP|nr:MONOCOPPER OXIDASE-LIKE PROTEIN SKS1 [Salix purpurea]